MSSVSQFQLTIRLRNFCNVIKNLENFFKKPTHLYTCKQALMMAYEKFESARDNFCKFINQLLPKNRNTLISKLERILTKLYRQNVSLLFN